MAETLNFTLSAQDKTKAAFGSLKNNLDGVEKASQKLGAVVGTIFAGGFFAKTVEVNKSFQGLKATLQTFLGDADKAAGAFGILQQYAKQTPFSLEDVVKGFNRMLSVGLNPTLKVLDSFGAIAAGTNKTLIDFVEAAADAAVGEFERLKEFGIKASKEGDKVKFTFKGITTEVKNDAQAIQDYLVQLGETQFGGALALQASTIGGVLSNLKDSFDEFFMSIGESGFNEAFNRLIANFSTLIGKAEPLANFLGNVFTAALNLLNGVMLGLAATIESVSTRGTILYNVFNGLLAVMVASFFINVASGMVMLARALFSAAAAGRIFGLIMNSNRIVLAATLAVAASFAGILDNVIDQIKIAAQRVDEAFGGRISEAMRVFTSDITESGESVEELDKKLKEFIGTTVIPGGQEMKNFGAETKDAADKVAMGTQNIGRELGMTFTSALEDAVLGGKKFGDVLKALINDIIKLAFRIMITEPLLQSFSNAFRGLSSGGGISDFFSSIFGGGSAQALATNASYEASGFPLPPIPMRAGGGAVSAKSPYMVGEKGPELFIPGAHGTIIPNQNLGMGGGESIVINQTINVSTGVQATVRAEIQSLMPQIATATKSAVLDARRRGGAFSTAFGG